jgi:hypothetical protein
MAVMVGVVVVGQSAVEGRRKSVNPDWRKSALLGGVDQTNQPSWTHLIHQKSNGQVGFNM